MSYSELLKSPKWQKKRLEIFKRDRFKCKLCSDTETSLNIHHTYYENGKLPWEYESESLVTLCEHCHYELKSLEITDIEDIKILKSTGWKNGSRIMFLIVKNNLRQKIYDKNDNYIAGFILGSEIIKIKKFIKNLQ